MANVNKKGYNFNENENIKKTKSIYYFFSYFKNNPFKSLLLSVVLSTVLIYKLFNIESSNNKELRNQEKNEPLFEKVDYLFEKFDDINYINFDHIMVKEKLIYFEKNINEKILKYFNESTIFLNFLLNEIENYIIWAKKYVEIYIYNNKNKLKNEIWKEYLVSLLHYIAGILKIYVKLVIFISSKNETFKLCTINYIIYNKISFLDENLENLYDYDFDYIYSIMNGNVYNISLLNKALSFYLDNSCYMNSLNNIN